MSSRKRRRSAGRKRRDGRRLWAPLGVLLALALAGVVFLALRARPPELAAAEDGAAALALSPQGLRIVELEIAKSGGGSVSLLAELAQTDAQRATGLMFRPRLPDGEGMLFVFEREERLSFWMQNTLIPLSIAFISAAGVINEIKDMQPLDLSAVPSARPARYALEVPQGWFDRAGVRAGDRISLNF